MIASKLLDDHTYGNKYYSHVGGVAVKEMNNLEVKLLGLLRYNLTVNADAFECYRFETERRCIVEVIRVDEYDAPYLEGNLSPNTSSEEDSSDDNSEEERKLTVLPPHPKSVLGMAKKKLRRSKSFSLDTTCFPRTHRRKRSSSFHIEVIA
jgi:hypothetical protein